MLVQRLTDRLHSLSDQQLAELLEQVLSEDAKFPTELLQLTPVAPPAAAPRVQQQPAPAMPTPAQQQQQQQQQEQQQQQARLRPEAQEQPVPPEYSAANESTAAAGSSSFGGATGAAGGAQEASDAVSDEQQEAPDLTEQLLQQFQRQLEARSGGIGAAGDRARSGSAPSAGDWPAVLADNWRLVALAIVGPAALIAALGQLLGRQGEAERLPEGQQDPTPPAAGAAVPPPAAMPATPPQATAAAQQQQQQQRLDQTAAKGAPKGRSVLAWLFSPTAAGEGPDEQAAAPEPAADILQHQPQHQPQQQATQQQTPPPPPLPPPPPPQAGAAAGAADAATAPGAVLWQRKAPLGPADNPAGSSSAILWQRRGSAATAVDSAPAAAQQTELAEPLPVPPQRGAEDALSSGSNAVSSEALAGEQGSDGGSAGGWAEATPDLWRMPLERLRSGAGSGSGPPVGVQAVSKGEAASSSAAASADTGPQATGQAGRTGAAANGASAGAVLPIAPEAASAVAPAAAEVMAAAIEGRQRSSSPAPGRRPASPLDNAEPDGWLGRLHRMGRRPPAPAGQRDPDA